jgi:hypothetical protein
MDPNLVLLPLEIELFIPRIPRQIDIGEDIQN